MNTADLFQQIQARLNQLWQDNSLKSREEVSKILHTLTEHTLHSLNLVSREEFDAQKKVLNEMQHIITELEQKISVLEKEATATNPGSAKQEPTKTFIEPND